MENTASHRRSYQQFCGLARALDVIGDRWTLLVVRELLIGPRRFGELRAGLPGIATNLLAERLRLLERDGIIERRLGEAAADGTSYALTARGCELRSVIEGLIRWSVPLMTTGQGEDELRPEWLAVALPALVRARPRRPTRIGVQAGDHHLVLEVGPGGSMTSLGRAPDVDARLNAAPAVVLALACGLVDLKGAARLGAKLSGARTALEGIFGRGRERTTPGRDRSHGV